MNATIYIHTIDGHPAMFDGDQICFANFYGPGNTPCYSLQEIRSQQQKSKTYRRKRNFDDSMKYGYVRYRINV